MSSPINDVYFIPVVYKKLGGIHHVHIFSFLLRSVKKCFLLKTSKDTFLSLHYPLPEFGLRGIKPRALAGYFSLNSSLHFCLWHLLSL